MSKKRKSYRGQRKYKNALHSICGCFYCTGYSKDDLYRKLEKQSNKDVISVLTKEIN